MKLLSPILADIPSGGMVQFWCPGCQERHNVIVTQVTPGKPLWGYNNNPDAPTFTPSILVRGTKFTEKGQAEYDAWVAAKYPIQGKTDFDRMDTVCHSFVTNGQIQFLGDCTHALANQTVPLPPMPVRKDD